MTAASCWCGSIIMSEFETIISLGRLYIVKCNQFETDLQLLSLPNSKQCFSVTILGYILVLHMHPPEQHIGALRG